MTAEPLPPRASPASRPSRRAHPRHGTDPASRRKVAFLVEQTRNPAEMARRLRTSAADAEDLLQHTAIEFSRATIHPAAWWSWWSAALRSRRVDLARAAKRVHKYTPALERHVQHTQPASRSPEDELIRRESAPVVGWFLDQVKPGRREVVERHLLDNQMPAQIAAELGVPIETVKSRLKRGLADMRAALRRQPAGEQERLWRALAALAAFLVSLWVRVVGRVHRRSGAPGAGSVPAMAAGQRGRGPASSLVACAAVLVAFTAHDRLPAPTLAEEAENDVRAAGWSSFLPHLPAWAEREIESGSAQGSFRAAGAASPAPAARSQALSPGQRAFARGLLGRATAAVQEGQIGRGKAALHIYDQTFPDNPLAQHRAEVAASLAAMGSR